MASNFDKLKLRASSASNISSKLDKVGAGIGAVANGVSAGFAIKNAIKNPNTQNVTRATVKTTAAVI